jgi:hypothetical protein
MYKRCLSACLTYARGDGDHRCYEKCIRQKNCRKNGDFYIEEEKNMTSLVFEEKRQLVFAKLGKTR